MATNTLTWGNAMDAISVAQADAVLVTARVGKREELVGSDVVMYIEDICVTLQLRLDDMPTAVKRLSSEARADPKKIYPLRDTFAKIASAIKATLPGQ